MHSSPSAPRCPCRYKADGKYPCNLFGQVRMVHGSPPQGPLLSSCPAAEGQLWAYVEAITFAQVRDHSGVDGQPYLWSASYYAATASQGAQYHGKADTEWMAAAE